MNDYEDDLLADMPWDELRERAADMATFGVAYELRRKERDELRTENARMAAALDRIAGHAPLLNAWDDERTHYFVCASCDGVWPRKLTDDEPCDGCIARTARGAVVDTR